MTRQIAELSPTHASMHFAASLKLHLPYIHQHMLSGRTCSNHGDSDLCCMPQMQRASQDSSMYICFDKAASVFGQTQQAVGHLHVPRCAEQPMKRNQLIDCSTGWLKALIRKP